MACTGALCKAQSAASCCKLTVTAADEFAAHKDLGNSSPARDIIKSILHVLAVGCADPQPATFSSCNFTQRHQTNKTPASMQLTSLVCLPSVTLMDNCAAQHVQHTLHNFITECMEAARHAQKRSRSGPLAAQKPDMHACIHS